MVHDQIELRTDDGTCPAHVFHPDGSGPWPAALMYIDGIGMRPAMLAIGERLASAGYYVLVPDMFYRAGAYTAPDPKALFANPEVRAAWFQLVQPHASAEKAMRDTRAFLDHLASAKGVRGGKVGVFGYCMGGRIALTAAGTFPERFACAAAYHPGGLVTDAPDSTHLLVPKIRARVYIAAASDDQSVPEDQKQRLAKALADAHVDHVMETYPARHGWVPRDTPVHDAAQTERHWQTLTDLLARSLV